MRTDPFRTRLVLLALLGVTTLASVAVAAFYVGAWLARPHHSPGPEAAGPSLRFAAHYEGAPAHVVEDLVTVPLENALAGLDGIETVESFSREGDAVLTAYLRPGTDLNQALMLAQSRIDQALPGLPEAVQKQGVSVTKSGPLPALWVVLSSPDQGRDSLVLRRDAEIKLLPLLTAAPGVAAATAGPGPGPHTHIVLNPEQLAACRLSFADILRALREMPAGPDRDMTPEQLAELIVRTDADGKMVPLKDVGSVERVGGEPGGVARWHGESVAFVAVESDEPARLSEIMADHLPSWRRRLPRGTELEVLPGPALPESEALLVEGRLPAVASPAEVRDMADRIATALQRLPDAKAEHLIAAVLTLPTEQPTLFRLYVALCPSSERAAALAEVRERIRQELKEYGDLISRVVAPAFLEQPPRLRAPLVLRVSGPALSEAVRLADEVFDRLSRDGVVTDLWPDYAGHTPPRLTLDVDTDRATRLGVSVADVLATLQVLRGPLEVQEIVPGLFVELKSAGPDRLADVNQLLQVRNDQGAMVPLSTLVAIREVRGPAVLHRLDGQRCLLLTASPAPGVSIEEASRRCRALAARARNDLGMVRCQLSVDSWLPNRP